MLIAESLPILCTILRGKLQHNQRVLLTVILTDVGLIGSPHVFKQTALSTLCSNIRTPVVVSTVAKS